MPDTTPNLSLPLLMQSQAQKHVTHNEALGRLDTLVQAVALTRAMTTPPSDANEGDCHIVPAGATGDWTGQEGRLAVYSQTAWAFISAKQGWQVFSIEDSAPLVFNGVEWTAQNTANAQPAQILGPVSMSEGAPTGAVIERGSNADGAFVRFADGTQICTHEITVPTLITPFGAIFGSVAQVWNFPADFAAGTTVCVSMGSNRSEVWGISAWNGSNQATLRAVSFQSISSGCKLYVTAVGRWA